MTTIMLCIFLSVCASSMQASSREPRYLGMGGDVVHRRDMDDSRGRTRASAFDEGFEEYSDHRRDDRQTSRSHAFDDHSGGAGRYEVLDEERSVSVGDQQRHLSAITADFRAKRYSFSESMHEAKLLLARQDLAEPYLSDMNRFFSELYANEDRSAAWQGVSEVFNNLWLAVLGPKHGEYDATWAAVQLFAALDKHGRTKDMGKRERKFYEFAWQEARDLVAVGLYLSFDGERKSVSLKKLNDIMQTKRELLLGISRRSRDEDNLVHALQHKISLLIHRDNPRRRDLRDDGHGMRTASVEVSRGRHPDEEGWVKRTGNRMSRWWGGA